MRSPVRKLIGFKFYRFPEKTSTIYGVRRGGRQTCEHATGSGLVGLASERVQFERYSQTWESSRDLWRFDSSDTVAVLLCGEVQRLPEYCRDCCDLPDLHRNHGSRLGILGHEAGRLVEVKKLNEEAVV